MMRFRGSLHARRSATALLLAVFLLCGSAPARAKLIAVPPPAPALGSASATRWIVAMQPGSHLAPLATRASLLGLGIDRIMPSGVPSMLITGPSRLLSLLGTVPGVAAIIQDTELTIRDNLDPVVWEIDMPETAHEVVPTGVARIGGPGTTTATDVDVAVVDTGLDADHPDLNIAGGVDCTPTSRPELVSGQPAWDDGNGHGTSVAGPLAAKADGRGIVGVAPGARLWAVEVMSSPAELTDAETGTPADVLLPSAFLCALDWLAANGDMIEVANMSFRFDMPVTGPCNGMLDVLAPAIAVPDPARPLATANSPMLADLLHEAMCRVVASGVSVTAGAGNEAAPVAFSGGEAVPAAWPEAIAVSAMTDYDGRPGGLAGEGGSCSWAFFPYLGKVVPPDIYEQYYLESPVRDAVLGPYDPEMYIDDDDTFADDFSNYGPEVDLAAPGVCLLTTWPDGRYAQSEGTSDAAPHVAGAAALIKATDRNVSPADVRRLLIAGATDDYDATDDPDGVPDPLVNVADL